MRALASLMLKGRKARRRGELAFTLAELAIVIAILAILVSIAVPVFLGQAHRAEHAVAVENLMTASKVVDNLWFNKLANQPNPITTGAYRDYEPPPEMSGEMTDGYVPVDAQYMSIREPKIMWVDVAVGSGSGGMSQPIASLENGPYAAAGSGYTLEGIWKNGQQVGFGSEIANDWKQMAGKVGVVENKYYWDGSWQDNIDNQYLTLMTLEVTKSLAHFYTLNVGVTVAGGTFDWQNGAGSPGDSFGDELASEKPPSGGDQPPGGDDPPPPGGDDPPPGGDDPPPPGGDDPPPPGDDPPVTLPEEPPATQPEPPGPPSGPNQASSIKITPQSLNPDANGVFKARIDLASGYDVDDINPSTVRSYGAAPTDWKTTGNGTLTLTFRRGDLVDVPVGDNVMFLVTGTYYDGTPFQAWDYIKVLG